MSNGTQRKPITLYITPFIVKWSKNVVAIYLGIATVFFFVGQYSTGWNRPSPSKAEFKKSSADAEESETDEEEDMNSLSQVQAGSFENCKLILVVRTDLKMTPGKIAAQCGHATLACYKTLARENPKLVRHWERTGQAKIAVKCDSEDAMMELAGIAKSLKLCTRVIQDAGRTQIAAGSSTVLGIGPGPVSLVNQVTGHLRLL